MPMRPKHSSAAAAGRAGGRGVLFPQVEQQMGAELGELGAMLVECKEKLTRSTQDLEGPAT